MSGPGFAPGVVIPTRAPLEESESEVVRRHAAAFRREWPEPARDPGAYRPTPAPPKTARVVELAELEETGRSKRVQTVKAATEAGWSVRIDLAEAPDGEGGRSVVVRCSRPGGGLWFNRRRCVAYWSAKPGKALTFVAAFGWLDRRSGRPEELVRLGATELLPYLRSGGEAPAREPAAGPSLPEERHLRAVA